MSYACDLYQNGCQKNPCIHENGFGYLEIEKCQLLTLTGLMLMEADGAKNIMNRRDRLLNLSERFLEKYEIYDKKFGRSKEWTGTKAEVKPLLEAVQKIVSNATLKTKTTNGPEYSIIRTSLERNVTDLKKKMNEFDPIYRSS